MKMMPAETDEMDSLYEGESKEAPESVDQEEAESMETTAVVPMKMLQGKSSEPLKVGDEVVVKVSSIHGDEVQIAYSQTKPGEIGKGEEAGGEEQSPDEEIDSLNTGSY
jgi:hypothetical protein